jgi:hypothetical protein
MNKQRRKQLSVASSEVEMDLRPAGTPSSSVPPTRPTRLTRAQLMHRWSKVDGRSHSCELEAWKHGTRKGEGRGRHLSEGDIIQLLICFC